MYPVTLPEVPLTLLRVDCFPSVIKCLLCLSNGSAYFESPATGVMVWYAIMVNGRPVRTGPLLKLSIGL